MAGGSPARAAGPRPARPLGAAAANAASSGERAPGRASARKASLIARPVVIALAAIAVVNAVGAPYYLASPAERVRSALHPWLKPSGTIGQAAGILSFALFTFIWLYPLRKKLGRARFLGAVGRWLDVHIAAGLVLPVLAATHASWRFSGLIGLGYAAMLVVSLSGVVGRYLYTRIPRSRSGLELTAEEAQQEHDRLLERLAAATGLPREELTRRFAPDRAPARGLAGTMRALVADDLERRRATRAFVRERQAAQGVALDRGSLRALSRLARRQMGLAQQMRMLDATHAAFRYWHVAHRPIAVSAFLAVAIHVVVAVAMGATWFW